MSLLTVTNSISQNHIHTLAVLLRAGSVQSWHTAAGYMYRCELYLCLCTGVAHLNVMVRVTHQLYVYEKQHTRGLSLALALAQLAVPP